LKISWDFVVLGRVIRYKGRFLDVVPSEGDRREVICLMLIVSNPRVNQSFRNILRWGIGREVTQDCFDGFL
jgi:hypothetical protein